MNVISFAAANLFENPLVLLVILLLSALANWLMKGRQATQEENWPDGDEPPTVPGPKGRSERERAMQEALRRLMGGEPPLREPSPPPVPPADREEQSSQPWFDEEERPPERGWSHEAETSPAAIPREVREAIETRLQHAGLAQPPRRFGQVDQPSSHPAMIASTHRRRHSREGARAIALVRDARTVRQVFVASLVFGPPKAFDTGHL